MASWKTTLVLAIVMAFSCGWLGWRLRPQGETAFPLARESQCAPAAVSAMPEGQSSGARVTVSSRQRRRQKRSSTRRPQRGEHDMFRLKTTKSLEEQRLYELKLYSALNKIQEVYSACPNGTFGEGSDLEKAARDQQGMLASAHKKFLLLEDYILNTEFTELNEDEQAALDQFYDLRKRIDEANSNYFDTPLESWLQLAREKKKLVYRWNIQELLKRQFEKDYNGTMALDEAFREFFPRIDTHQSEIVVDGRKIMINLKIPNQNSGMPVYNWNGRYFYGRYSLQTKSILGGDC